MCGPFCSVPPVGMMTVVLPPAMASRTSIHVRSSRKTLSGCGTAGACAEALGAEQHTRGVTRTVATARMTLLIGSLIGGITFALPLGCCATVPQRAGSIRVLGRDFNCCVKVDFPGATSGSDAAVARSRNWEGGLTQTAAATLSR